MSSRLPRRPRAAPVLAMAALSLLAAAAAPGAAQTTPTEEAVTTFVRPGEIIRVRVRGGAAWEGDFAGARGGRLLLAGGGDTLALDAADVDALWVRARRVRSGAEKGALVGAGIGLGIGGFFALLAQVEGGPDDAGAGRVLLTTAALGATTGAALGGTVGAARTRWRQVLPADPGVRPALPGMVKTVGEQAPAGDAAALPTRRRFGSVDGAVSYARLEKTGVGGGAGARVALLAEVRRGGPGGGSRLAVAFGPEVEVQSVGRHRRREAVYDQDCLPGTPGCSPIGYDNRSASYAAAAARMVARVGPEFALSRVYGMVGAGMHGWHSDGGLDDGWYVHPAGVAGAGMQVRPGRGPLSVGLEGRMNRVVLSGDDQPGRFWTAGLTVNTSL